MAGKHVGGANYRVTAPYPGSKENLWYEAGYSGRPNAPASDPVGQAAYAAGVAGAQEECAGPSVGYSPTFVNFGGNGNLDCTFPPGAIPTQDGNITVSLWIRPNVTFSSNQTFFVVGESGVAANYNYRCQYVNSGTEWEAHAKDEAFANAGGFAEAIQTFTAGQLYHLYASDSPNAPVGERLSAVNSSNTGTAATGVNIGFGVANLLRLGKTLSGGNAINAQVTDFYVTFAGVADRAVLYNNGTPPDLDQLISGAQVPSAFANFGGSQTAADWLAGNNKGTAQGSTFIWLGSNISAV